MTIRCLRPVPGQTARRPHAQAHFPPLSAEEALLFVRLLERVCEALWRTHGHAMAQLLHRELDRQIAVSPRSRKAHHAIHAICDNLPQDDDIPF
jgi:hypothetical protein